MNVGQLVSVIFVTLYLINNIGDFAGEIKDFVFDLGVLSEMQSYLNDLFSFSNNVSVGEAMPPIKNTLVSTTVPVTSGEVIFDNVTFRYPSREDYALRNVRLTLHPRQTVVFKGKIGSGKSTMTKLLLKLYTPDAGHIAIDGHDIAHFTPQTIRQHIGYVAQSPVLFNRSIYENIVYGSPIPITKDTVETYIEQSGVMPLFETVPNGIDTRVGKRGEYLSGGQRQAVVLLRLALADQHKPIYILDEPTSAMDYESKHYVLGLLRKVIQHKTCIIVSHDDDVIHAADRVVEFRRGVVVSES
jgi:ABC-type bacteriocin/lantibiotic exporter with double-glycine peptidase domain